MRWNSTSALPAASLVLVVSLLLSLSASAHHVEFGNDRRRLAPPHSDVYADPPLGVFSETIKDSGFRVTQSSWFSEDRFRGRGAAKAPAFEPVIGPDPAASSGAFFDFTVTETTKFRIQATLDSVGHAGSSVGIFEAVSPFTSYASACAGYFCDAPGLFFDKETLDTVVTLPPGAYSFGALSNVEAQDSAGPDRGTWEVVLTSPPAVPMARGAQLGMLASLLGLGFAGLRRRAEARRT